MTEYSITLPYKDFLEMQKHIKLLEKAVDDLKEGKKWDKLVVIDSRLPYETYFTKDAELKLQREVECYEMKIEEYKKIINPR